MGLPLNFASLYLYWLQFQRQSFYCLWPKILQIQLDKFVEYWNNHKIRTQKERSTMLGATPRHGFTVPAQDCRITVNQAMINALRLQIPIPREESMRWVDDSFEHAAREDLVWIKSR